MHGARPVMVCRRNSVRLPASRAPMQHTVMLMGSRALIRKTSLSSSFYFQLHPYVMILVVETFMHVFNFLILCDTTEMYSNGIICSTELNWKHKPIKSEFSV